MCCAVLCCTLVSVKPFYGRLTCDMQSHDKKFELGYSLISTIDVDNSVKINVNMQIFTYQWTNNTKTCFSSLLLADDCAVFTAVQDFFMQGNTNTVTKKWQKHSLRLERVKYTVRLRKLLLN